MSKVFILDYEASGLDQRVSYPIEAGWAQLTIETGEITSGSTLITPAKTWKHWNQDSEAVHGIQRASLCNGRSVEEVADDLNTLLTGSDVICDGGDFDLFWTNRLYFAANTDRRWKLGSFWEFMNNHLFEMNNDLAQLRRMVASSRFREPRPHRAEQDARVLADILFEAINPSYKGTCP